MLAQCPVPSAHACCHWIEACVLHCLCTGSSQIQCMTMLFAIVIATATVTLASFFVVTEERILAHSDWLSSVWANFSLRDFQVHKRSRFLCRRKSTLTSVEFCCRFGAGSRQRNGTAKEACRDSFSKVLPVPSMNDSDTGVQARQEATALV